MKIINFEIEEKKYYFKNYFKHSLSKRKQTEVLIVTLYSKNNKGVGECIVREYLTGENILIAKKNLQEIIIPFFMKKNYNNLNEIILEIELFFEKLKKNQYGAFSAFETAFLNLSAKELNFDIEDIFKNKKLKTELQEQKFTLPISDSNFIKQIFFLSKLKKKEINFIKIKLSKKSFYKMFLYSFFLYNKNIVIDFNDSLDINIFEKYLIKVDKLKKKFQIKEILIEEPFIINLNNLKQVEEILSKFEIKVILDESFVTIEEAKPFFNKETFLFNIRIAKNGGIINSLNIIKINQRYNKKNFLGCLVGENILTRYNLIIGQYLDLYYHEGNYDTYLLKQRSITNPKFNQNLNLKQKFSLRWDK